MSTATAIHFGKNAELSYNIGGVGGAGWNVLNNVKNVTPNKGSVTWDGTVRGSAFQENVPVLKTLQIEIEAVYDPTDAGMAALEAAYEGQTIIGLKALHVTGGKGPQADFYITDFPRPEELQAGLIVNITAQFAGNYTPV